MILNVGTDLKKILILLIDDNPIPISVIRTLSTVWLSWMAFSTIVRQTIYAFLSGA